jgi:hypothetical protein
VRVLGSDTFLAVLFTANGVGYSTVSLRHQRVRLATTRSKSKEEPIMMKPDHTDHSRTTQPHAGQWLKNGRGLPGILLMALAILAVVSSNAGAAYRSPTWEIIAMAIVAVAAMSAGAGWVLVEGRRIGRVEVKWLSAHPDGPVPGCTDPACCQYFAKLRHPAGHSSFCAAQAV